MAHGLFVPGVDGVEEPADDVTKLFRRFHGRQSHGSPPSAQRRAVGACIDGGSARCTTVE